MPARKPAQTASLKHEQHFLAVGCRYIMGIDEVGRGPWAGPVVAAAVCLPIWETNLQKQLKGVRDSKVMTHLQRVCYVEAIRETAVSWGLGLASAEEIDHVGLIPASKLSMLRALDAAQEQASLQIDLLLLDYMVLPERREIPQFSIVKGDAQSLSIAAASVLAKVWRDDYMSKMAETYPEYGFEKHKGYGTEAHREVIQKHGICPLHRLSYQPIQQILADRK